MQWVIEERGLPHDPLAACAIIEGLTSTAMKLFQGLVCILCASLFAGPAAAQSEIRDRSHLRAVSAGSHIPIKRRDVPPINLANSSRLESLVRGGNLYLSAQDVVALALENNIDIEVQRYGPLLAEEVLRRAKGGGALRSVGLGVAQGPQSVSLTGVSTAIQVSLSAGNGVSSGGGIVTQLGRQFHRIDPSFSVLALYQHITSPQSNTFLTGTTALVLGTRTYQASTRRAWDFGLSSQWTYTSQHTHVNSAQYDLNPYTTGSSGSATHPALLQGFGRAGERLAISASRKTT